VLPEPDTRTGYQTPEPAAVSIKIPDESLEINLKAFGAMSYAYRSWSGIQNIRQWKDAHDCDLERRTAG
jgi:hypothetical protein